MTFNRGYMFASCGYGLFHAMKTLHHATINIYNRERKEDMTFASFVEIKVRNDL